MLKLEAAGGKAEHQSGDSHASFQKYLNMHSEYSNLTFFQSVLYMDNLRAWVLLLNQKLRDPEFAFKTSSAGNSHSH